MLGTSSSSPMSSSGSGWSRATTSVESQGGPATTQGTSGRSAAPSAISGKSVWSYTFPEKEPYRPSSIRYQVRPPRTDLPITDVTSVTASALRQRPGSAMMRGRMSPKVSSMAADSDRQNSSSEMIDSRYGDGMPPPMSS